MRLVKLEVIISLSTKTRYVLINPEHISWIDLPSRTVWMSSGSQMHPTIEALQGLLERIKVNGHVDE